MFEPATQPDRATAGTFYIPIYNGQLLTAADGKWRPLNQADFTATALRVKSQHFIGYYNNAACWAVEIASEHRLEANLQWLGLRAQLGLIAEDCFLLAGRALQVVQWHVDHQFCGRCGCPTITDENDRAKYCRSCNHHAYPRLSPCIIVLITRGDHCLLARHARSASGVYTSLAGFVEVGERIEDTVHREIMEEVGLKVTSLRYFHSQPWPFPGQLMLGFHVEYESGDICVDGDEILDAQWYRYDKLPQVPPVATLAGQLISHFVSERKSLSHSQ